MGYALTRPVRLSLEEFSRAADLHPDLVRRITVLGLLSPHADVAGQLWFAPAELTTIAQIRRLRAGLGLNYVAVGVVLDLLARIDHLEAALRAAGRTTRRSDQWTPTD